MAGITPHRKGYLRDKEIVNLIETHHALNTDQIVSLLFRFPYGRRKAQQRLATLCKRKRLQRLRVSMDTPFIYYIDRKHGRLEHLIELNWAYVWLRNNLTSGKWIYHWSNEVDFQVLQSDGLCGVRNDFTKEYEWYFIELDRSGSHNPFDKVKRYNDLYDRQEELLSGKWWWQYATKFPKILIITETPKKQARILESIGKDNRNGLRFECRLLSDIIEGAEWIG